MSAQARNKIILFPPIQRPTLNEIALAPILDSAVGNIQSITADATTRKTQLRAGCLRRPLANLRKGAHIGRQQQPNKSDLARRSILQCTAHAIIDGTAKEVQRESADWKRCDAFLLVKAPLIIFIVPA